jgi:hypothetical protein
VTNSGDERSVVQVMGQGSWGGNHWPCCRVSLPFLLFDPSMA